MQRVISLASTWITTSYNKASEVVIKRYISVFVQPLFKYVTVCGGDNNETLAFVQHFEVYYTFKVVVFITLNLDFYKMILRR